jgi:hypothetical protein
MRQAYRWLVVAALGVAAATGTAACGLATDRAADQVAESSVEVVETLGAKAGALAAMGFDLREVAAQEPGSPAGGSTANGAGPDAGGGAGADEVRRGEAWRKRHAYRVLLRKNTLHGEAVVKTRDGTRTVVVQRGTVTEVTDTSVTVKSTDGYTLIWTFGDRMHVIEHRTTIKASEITVGTEVGVAGTKDGDTATARLIVIPRR